MDTKLLTIEDEPALRAFLGRHVERAMFLLSNLHTAGFGDQHERLSGRYVGAYVGGELVGVACHYRMGNVIVCAPAHAGALGRAAVEASGWPIAGIVGPAPEVEAVVAALELGDRPARLDESEGLYRLELDQLQVPQALRDGSVRGRALRADDVEQVTDWMVRYRVESIGDPETEQLHARERAEQVAAVGSSEVWVLEHQGELVARSGFNARIPEAVQLGGVWTPHHLRGQGFARCVVASHLLVARDEGVRTAVLFTPDSNTPAQRAYAALGFQPIGHYRLLLLQAPATLA